MSDASVNQLDRSFNAALPFAASLLVLATVVIAAQLGGWWLLLPIVFGWHFSSIMDMLLGTNDENLDPNAADEDLFWYRAITVIWVPLQIVLIFAAIYYAVWVSGFSTTEKIVFMMGVGVASGAVGINYAHELMHQRPRIEREMADILMCSVLYGHFRSEHLLVHHRYVATPKDPVTARYNEGFHRFFPRVLIGCVKSSWAAEKAMLARKNLSVWHRSNPYWKYATLQLGFLFLAYLVGGWAGFGLFIIQAFTAIAQLELVNYVEHYGLTRRHLGEGRYEHVKPHHSWNAAHRYSNYLLINLQRHSDHHYKPDRRFPLLQTYAKEEAPQLPYGYPIMTITAIFPPLWRRWMNPKVRDWRRFHYADIEDWQAYNKASNPAPR